MRSNAAENSSGVMASHFSGPADEEPGPGNSFHLGEASEVIVHHHAILDGNMRPLQRAVDPHHLCRRHPLYRDLRGPRATGTDDFRRLNVALALRPTHLQRWMRNQQPGTGGAKLFIHATIARGRSLPRPRRRRGRISAGPTIWPLAAGAARRLWLPGARGLVGRGPRGTGGDCRGGPVELPARGTHPPAHSATPRHTP